MLEGNVSRLMILIVNIIILSSVLIGLKVAMPALVSAFDHYLEERRLEY